MSSDLIIEARSTDKAMILELYGRLYDEEAPALRQMFEMIHVEDAANILVDLAHTDYIDMTGVATLVNLILESRKQKQRVLISGIRPEFRRLFDLARLPLFITIADTEQDALAGLDKETT